MHTFTRNYGDYANGMCNDDRRRIEGNFFSSFFYCLLLFSEEVELLISDKIYSKYVLVTVVRSDVMCLRCISSLS